MIKFTDLYKLAPDKKTIFKKINFLIKNSQFIGGKEVVNFEREFSKYVNCKYSISSNVWGPFQHHRSREIMIIPRDSKNKIISEAYANLFLSTILTIYLDCTLCQIH